MSRIIAGGGLPEGKGWRLWLKMLLRALFPWRGGRM
ncbi:MAG: hypothetical protein QOE17_2290 [Gaiellales bacterium]|nr:hypothetical protein [Gaiellales bacterium]